MKQSWKFEPAVWKTAITGLVALAAIWGFNVSELGDKLTQSVDALALLIPALIALVANVAAGVWVRRTATPTAAVVEQVNKDGQVVAGPANEVVETGEVVRAAGTDLEHDLRGPNDVDYVGRHFDV